MKLKIKKKIFWQQWNYTGAKSKTMGVGGTASTLSEQTREASFFFLRKVIGRKQTKKQRLASE